MEKIFADLPLRNFAKGQILIYEGDPIENIYFLISGYVKVSNILTNGSHRTIFIYAPADAFPLTSFLSGAGVARYFYECMTDIDLKVMPQTKFQNLIKGNLEMGERLLTYTHELNMQFVDRIDTLSAQSAKHKVIALLVYLAAKTGTKQGNKVRLNMPLTTQNIADMCSLTRETTTVQLIKMKKDGLIAGTRHLLLDTTRLQKMLTP